MLKIKYLLWDSMVTEINFFPASNFLKVYYTLFWDRNDIPI